MLIHNQHLLIILMTDNLGEMSDKVIKGKIAKGTLLSFKNHANISGLSAAAEISIKTSELNDLHQDSSIVLSKF